MSYLFTEECVQAFKTLGKPLTSALVVKALDWTMSFELMCDASNFTIGDVLVQRHEKVFHIPYYARKILIEGHIKHTTMYKKLLVVVFAFDIFIS